MPEVRHTIGSLTLRARCDESLIPSAEWLLSTVASFAGRGKGLGDGIIVQVGWSLFRLRDDHGELAVCEPNYDANPFRDFRDDVTCTLSVLKRQVAFHQRLGIGSVPVRYDEKVVLRKGCLSERRVYAQRQQPKEGDSGWYIGPVDGPNSPPGLEDLESRYVFQLLAPRPSLLDIVNLPKDYLVVFDGAEVVGVQDPNGHEVWPGTE